MKTFVQVIAPTNAEILPPLPEPEAGELKKHLKQVQHMFFLMPLPFFSVCFPILCCSVAAGAQANVSGTASSSEHFSEKCLESRY